MINAPAANIFFFALLFLIALIDYSCTSKYQSGTESHKLGRTSMKGLKVFFIVAFFMWATALVGAKQPAGENPIDNRATPQFGGPRFDQASVDRGQQLFVAQCGFCHGSSATGGQSGPDLIRSVIV